MSYETGSGWQAPQRVTRRSLRRRPWFWIVVVTLLLFAGCTAVAAVVGGGAAVELEEAVGPSGGSVSPGLGANDATGDVRLGALAAPDAIGVRTGTVLVTNHSSGTSDYYVEVRVLDAAGTNIGFSNVLIQKVRPGQKARAEFQVVQEGAARVEVTEVQRTASS